jgi:hypothetical protein
LVHLEPNNPYIPQNIYSQTPLTPEGGLCYNIGVERKKGNDMNIIYTAAQVTNANSTAATAPILDVVGIVAIALVVLAICYLNRNN